MKKMSIVRGACITMIFIGLLNMVVFLAIDLHLGGDALNGKASSGHYYVYGYQPKTGQKGYTEVSEATFRYSKWHGHGYSALVAWGLMLVAGAVLKRAEKSK
jgi:hypothetical protein